MQKGGLALGGSRREGRQRQRRDIGVLAERRIELEDLHGRAGEGEVVRGRCQQ